MTRVGFLILFGLSFVLFRCQGQITSPPKGIDLTFLPESTAKITWSFNDSISDVISRVWYFTSSDGSFNAKLLARIIDDENPTIYKSGLSGVTIVKPATLILKNVNQTYNGTYLFSLGTANGGASDVYVFIAKKPNVTISCPSPAAVNEGNDFTCLCKGKGGNPPANITWYKGSKKIGGTGKEEQTLTLSNVNRTDSGAYKCVAQSHINATDEKSIEVIVKLNFKPENTMITFTAERAGVGRLVTIACNSRGVPEPSYNLTHNGTKISTNNTYTIHAVQYSDAGTYKCIARNKLGSDSASVYLTVVETPNVTINCSSPIILDEGEDRTCVCTSEGGNPPANLTWYKDDKQIGNASYGENRLTLTNVTKQHNGTYKCVAQRYTLTDEKSIEVKVRLNFEPMNTLITITPQNTVAVHESVTITCNSTGRPEPSYNITHDGTVVGTGKMYFISEATLSDGGTYTCIAWNKLGSNSDSAHLDVNVDPISDASPWWAILLIVISVVLTILAVIDVAMRCKSKEKGGGYSGNADVSPDGSGGVGVNQYELGGVNNAYDTVNPFGASGSESKSLKNTLPPVYASVDKSNREENR